MAVSEDDITTVLPRLLANVKRPGNFFGSGQVELPVVRIAVDGVGTLGLPIAPSQADALVRVGSPAPYGRGGDTLLDPTVRRCWQIPPTAVRLEDRRFRQVLDRVVADALAALGVEETAEAELYKLLVYDAGSFFVEHRDTEKVPGMFATLVVALPSEHEGGELVIRHAGRETTITLAGQDLGVARWAAFYADCVHELRPVRSGYRVALVYNLIRLSGRIPVPPEHRGESGRVASALLAWSDTPDTQVKVVYPLAHHYTPAELAFATLKNEDAAAADVLELACYQADCVLRLAMISIEESGSAEPIWRGRQRDRHDDDTDYTVVEVTERRQRVDGWRRLDDTEEARGAIPFDDDEVAPPGALSDEEPDEDHFHEATGNEGASFERTYRRAALVIWPVARELHLLHQGGPDVTIAALDRLAQDPGRAGETEALARIIVEGWPRPHPDGRWTGDPEQRARLLAALTRIGSGTQLGRFLSEVVAVGAFDGKETPELVNALGTLPPEAAGDVLSTLMGQLPCRRFAAACALFRAVAKARPGTYCRRAATVMIEHLGAWDTGWSGPQARALVDLVHALWALGEGDLAARLVAELRAHRVRWPVDGVLLPAVLTLWPPQSGVLSDLLVPLGDDCRHHLSLRVALPLTPPADTARSTKSLACKCADCRALRGFLGEPRTTTWTLKAHVEKRRHVEEEIRAAGVDVDCRTERRGSPHTLVCTKNQASYDARVRERKADLEALARLGNRSSLANTWKNSSSNTQAPSQWASPSGT